MLRHCAIGVMLLGAVAAQAEERPSLAVLGVEPTDVPEALAQQLTDALRQRAAGTQGIRVVPGKDLIEIKMVFGCDAGQPACIAGAGKSLGADKLIYGQLRKAAGSQGASHVVVALKLLDVKSATVERFVNDTVNKRELAAGSVNGSAAKWFSSLIEGFEGVAKPVLTVTSDPSGATVTVDGRDMGRTPVTLRDLPTGSHNVTITATNMKAATRTVELRAGGQAEVSVTLEPEPPQVVAQPDKKPPEPSTVAPPENKPPQTTTPSHAGRPAKYLALAALLGAVVTGSVAIYTWRTYSDLENTAHSDLVTVQNGNPTNANDPFFGKPNCSPPASLMGADKYRNDCKSGQTYATATTALWVVTGALAATAVVAYVVGDRQAAHAAEKGPKTTARLIRESLRIEPVLSTKGGALQAAFEF